MKPLMIWITRERAQNIVYALMFISVALGFAGFFHWMHSLGATPYILNILIGLTGIAIVLVILNGLGSVIRKIINKD